MLYDPKWEVETKPKEAWQNIMAKAADLLEHQYGFCQNRMFGNGTVCMRGAIYRALELTAPDSRARDKAARDLYARTAIHLCETGRTTGHRDNGHIGAEVRWNDTRGRMKSEVVNVLREMAEQ